MKRDSDVMSTSVYFTRSLKLIFSSRMARKERFIQTCAHCSLSNKMPAHIANRQRQTDTDYEYG